jgi:hypothetical protein
VESSCEFGIEPSGSTTSTLQPTEGSNSSCQLKNGNIAVPLPAAVPHYTCRISQRKTERDVNVHTILLSVLESSQPTSICPRKSLRSAKWEKMKHGPFSYIISELLRCMMHVSIEFQRSGAIPGTSSKSIGESFTSSDSTLHLSVCHVRQLVTISDRTWCRMLMCQCYGSVETVNRPNTDSTKFLKTPCHANPSSAADTQFATRCVCNAFCEKLLGKRTRLWSSGQSSWLQIGDVLPYICYVEEGRPPLWSSGQSSWLQIPGSRVRFSGTTKKLWVWNGVHSASWVQLWSYLIEK